MALWKDQATQRKEPTVMADPAPRPEPAPRTDIGAREEPRRGPDRAPRESLIAADIAIEGKIEGAGHVRIAGRFKGDVNVQGNLTIEAGAKLTGGVRAQTVIIAGELEGNIEAAARVELLDTGVLSGDLKAGSLTVAAGSRMRGQVEFGWDEKGIKKPTMASESSSAA
jgi:cytoskeletal protein CcmA (bactofilin family)